MRYSFHGKVRATGQQVDGFVEAASSSEAIDRLADRGIIGVYSVRPDPKPVKNAVRLAGEPEQVEIPESRRLPQQQQQRPGMAAAPRRIPPPSQKSIAPVAHALQPAAPASTPQSPNAQVWPSSNQTTQTSAVIADSSLAPLVAPTPDPLVLQLMEKLNMLMGRVETALSRPMNVTYQAGPVRNNALMAKRTNRVLQEAQTSTLHDIFQNNLDLRKSLDKLASTVNPPAVQDVEKVKPAIARAPSAHDSHDSVADVQVMPPAAAAVTTSVSNSASREGSGLRDLNRDISKPVRESVNGQKLAQAG